MRARLVFSGIAVRAAVPTDTFHLLQIVGGLCRSDIRRLDRRKQGELKLDAAIEDVRLSADVKMVLKVAMNTSHVWSLACVQCHRHSVILLFI